MNKSESIKELATALNKAQAEMSFAPMDAQNPFLKNKYADLGSIIKTAKPVLAKHGLSVSQLVESFDNQVGVVTLLMHSSGEWIESSAFLPLGEERGKSLAQVAGSVVTYLRRYAYASALGMYADEDTDGNHPVRSNGHKPQFDGITLEEAQNTLNSKGERYGDIPADKLAIMLNSLANVKNPNDDQLYKIEVIKVLLKARKDGVLETAQELGAVVTPAE